MGDLGKREIDILREKIANGPSPPKPTPAVVPKDHSGTEIVRMAQPDVLSTGEQSSDMDFQLDEDSGSEYGDDVVRPAKRKRRTNNSFAVDLEDDDLEIAMPPPPKRLQFNSNGKENSVLIGVWKDSPSSDPSKKHAIYAFLDSADKIRQKVYPETRDGETFQEGYPSGTGRAFVQPDNVLLDPHLSSLSRQELKEFVRLRMSRSPNESPEEQKQAEVLAVEEAKKIANNTLPSPTPRSIPNTPATQLKSAKPATPSTPKGAIPNGIFLGYWKDSDAAKITDKHATFGVVDSNRLRVKIIKFTRDGKFYQGNFPTNPGSNWIPFDDVIREPSLEKLLRLEVIEYVKIRQNEQGRPGFDPFGVDENAIKKAIETFGLMAKAQGLSAAKLDAQNESSRRAHNQSRAALKATPVAAKSSKYESPYTKTNLDNSHIQDVASEAIGRTKQIEHHMTRTDESFNTTPRGVESTGIRENPSITNSSKTDLSTPKSYGPEAIAGASKTDAPDGKAKAVKSRKAEADAIAEKLRRVREAAAKAKENAKANEVTKDPFFDKGVRSARDREDISESLSGLPARMPQELVRQSKEAASAILKKGEEGINEYSLRRVRETGKQDEIARQAESMTPRQRAMKEAEAREKEIKANEAREKELRDREAAEARAEMEKARAEMEKAKADAIESVSNEFFNNIDSFEDRTDARSTGQRTVGPSPDPVIPTNRPRQTAEVKIHNDVRYVRQEKGPFSGKLVGEKKEFLTIDGENYVECRILMRAEF
jgi:hypothetical protein